MSIVHEGTIRPMILVKRAALPDIRLYDLRHTAATLALTVGVSPKVVSEQLGHTSAAFTLDIYSHVLPHMQDDAAAKVEAALMGQRNPRNVGGNSKSQSLFHALQQLGRSKAERFGEVEQCAERRALLAALQLTHVITVISSPVSKRIL